MRLTMIITGFLLLWTSKGFAQNAKSVFCDRLGASLQSQLPTELAAGQAQLAAMQLVDLIRSEQVSDYIAANSLKSANLAGVYSNKDRFVSTANVFRDALGMNPNKAAMLVMDLGELRFLPYAQQGSQYIVLAKSAFPLSPERADAVASAAAAANISISYLWYGPELKDPSAQIQADLLGMISQRTRGLFVDLSGLNNVCGTRS